MGGIGCIVLAILFHDIFNFFNVKNGVSCGFSIEATTKSGAKVKEKRKL
jgi:hypothetical protein